MSGRPRLLATYRLQLTPEFRFDDAAALVPMLADLGASHLYASPVFEARPGSRHGYDQVDPRRVRAELGGQEGFERLSAALRRAGLGLLLDIVPNHLAAHHANPWWWALLRDGRGSEADRFFEVDWDGGGGRVVLPVLGGDPSDLIARREITVERGHDGAPFLRYHDHRFPLRADAAIEPGAGAAAIDAALRAQHYELVEWRAGLRRVNTRRFFNISELVGVRVEDPIVFAATHATLLELVRRGAVHGVRVDHVDGLRDPLAYLRRLRAALDEAADDGDPRVPIFVEKILGREETIPDEWPVDGATGYGFMAAVGACMVDPAGLGDLRRHAIARQTGARDFHSLAVQCKREAANALLAPELDRLMRLVSAALAAAGAEADGTERDAIVSLSARLPVYRTYADRSGMSESDAALVRQAAAPVNAATPPAIVDMLTLSGVFAQGPAREAALEALLAWQQFTGPLAAKGVEDTALYRDVACLSLNDVGQEPVASDASAEIDRLALQRRTRPLWMNATDTHDAKRSEDVRARLAVLSRAAGDWLLLLDETVGTLQAALVDRNPAPSERDLSLLVHSAFALLPLRGRADAALGDRVKQCMIKSAREARLATSWTRPDPGYETACRAAVDLLLESRRFAAARRRLADLSRRTRPIAARLSIAAVLLKTLFPGTPDWYQGAECRLLSLVDPDNRRAVDFAERRRLMSVLRAKWSEQPTAVARDSLRTPDRDAAKLYCTWRALAMRRWLLDRSAEIELVDALISNDAWSWSVRAGSERCSVRVSIVPGAHDPAPPPERSINQLTGVVDDRRAFASIVIHGATALL